SDRTLTGRTDRLALKSCIWLPLRLGIGLSLKDLESAYVGPGSAGTSAVAWSPAPTLSVCHQARIALSIRNLASVDRELAADADRYGSLWRGSPSRQAVARAGTRCAHHPCAVRKALRQIAEERLQRCGGRSRGSTATDDAVRADQD